MVSKTRFTWTRGATQQKGGGRRGQRASTHVSQPSHSIPLDFASFRIISFVRRTGFSSRGMVGSTYALRALRNELAVWEPRDILRNRAVAGHGDRSIECSTAPANAWAGPPHSAFFGRQRISARAVSDANVTFCFLLGSTERQCVSVCCVRAIVDEWLPVHCSHRCVGQGADLLPFPFGRFGFPALVFIARGGSPLVELELFECAGWGDV